VAALATREVLGHPLALLGRQPAVEERRDVFEGRATVHSLACISRRSRHHSISKYAPIFGRMGSAVLRDGRKPGFTTPLLMIILWNAEEPTDLVGADSPAFELLPERFQDPLQAAVQRLLLEAEPARDCGDLELTAHLGEEGILWRELPESLRQEPQNLQSPGRLLPDI